MLLLTGIMIPTQNSLKDQKDRPDWLWRARIIAGLGTGIGILIGRKLGKTGKEAELIDKLKIGGFAMVGLGVSQAVIGATGGPEDASFAVGNQAGEALLGVMIVEKMIQYSNKKALGSVLPIAGLAIGGIVAVGGGIIGGPVGKIGNKGGAKVKELASKIYYRLAQRDRKDKNDN